jgi:hypothetical protein
MHTMTLIKPFMAISTRFWNEAGNSKSPNGLMIHSNCLKPDTVKAVKCFDCSSRGICQNPEVRSRVANMLDHVCQMSQIHSFMSFMEYLSSWLWSFNCLKSCTILRLSSFFGTMNKGLLYLDLLGWMIPIFNQHLISPSSN